MKVFFLILIAAVNLFMHVNSTEKRRITCGKRATFYIYFHLLDSLIPSHKLISGMNSFLPYSASSPVPRDSPSLSTLFLIILHSRISLVSLGLSSCSRVPQSPLSLGKASGGGSSLLTFYIFSFILLAIDLVLAVW